VCGSYLWLCRAVNGGGGLKSISSEMSLTGCIVSGNTAATGGGFQVCHCLSIQCYTHHTTVQLQALAGHHSVLLTILRVVSLVTTFTFLFHCATQDYEHHEIHMDPPYSWHQTRQMLTRQNTGSNYILPHHQCQYHVRNRQMTTG